MRWKKREDMSLLAVSINSRATRSGLRASAPRKPAMSTACCLGSLATTSTAAVSAAGAGGSVMSNSPVGSGPNISAVKARTSSKETSPKMASTPFFAVTQVSRKASNWVRVRAPTDSAVPFERSP